jgi:hypothetical protein
MPATEPTPERPSKEGPSFDISVSANASANDDEEITILGSQASGKEIAAFSLAATARFCKALPEAAAQTIPVIVVDVTQTSAANPILQEVARKIPPELKPILEEVAQIPPGPKPIGQGLTRVAHIFIHRAPALGGTRRCRGDEECG